MSASRDEGADDDLDQFLYGGEGNAGADDKQKDNVQAATIIDEVIDAEDDEEDESDEDVRSVRVCACVRVMSTRMLDMPSYRATSISAGPGDCHGR